MRGIIAFLTQCCLLVFIFTACNKNEDAPSSTATSAPANVVSAEALGLEISAGSAAEAAVRVKIAEGYHVNANPPTLPYLKATELQIETSEGITAGQVIYPPAELKRFSFDETQPLAVYEGEVTIKVPLSADAAATKGARSLRAKLRTQACDDKACYPPRIADVSIPVTIK